MTDLQLTTIAWLVDVHLTAVEENCSCAYRSELNGIASLLPLFKSELRDATAARIEAIRPEQIDQ